jgi:hypothetical protein
VAKPVAKPAGISGAKKPVPAAAKTAARPAVKPAVKKAVMPVVKARAIAGKKAARR